MSRPDDQHVIHELVIGMTNGLQDVEVIFTPDELVAAAFRYVRHTCNIALQQAPDQVHMRERLKQRVTSLLFDLQLSSETPKDVKLEPQLPLIEEES